MKQNLIANAQITINAPVSIVWNALVDPSLIKQYMFGTKVSSEWKEGSTIVWSGEWQGKTYEDKGEIIKFQPERILQYTHYSPLAGAADLPENYHTVTIELVANGNQTTVHLTQDNNATEQAKQHTEKKLGYDAGWIE